MEEVTDSLMNNIEKYLDNIDVDLSVHDMDEIRDTLDYVLSKYEEE